MLNNRKAIGASRHKALAAFFLIATAPLLLHAVAPEDSEGKATQSAAPQPTSQPAADRDKPSRILSGLIGSKHDFSGSELRARDLCLPCHVPHLPAGAAPRYDARIAATQPLRTYESLGVELDSASILCLSCHNGVVAPDVYTSSHATAFANQLGASQRGLLRGHPVGIPYPTAEPKLHPAAAVTADGRLKLPGGRVQCTTCHDPHNTGRHARMLVKSNERSRLCLSCHRL